MSEQILPPFPTIPNVEIKPISGLPGYAVTSSGKILSCKNFGYSGKNYGAAYREFWREIKPYPSTQGYLRIVLSQEGEQFHKAVHRLVLEAFIGPCPEGMQGCHNDGNPMNNSAQNLRWDTPKANSADRVLHGTASMGHRNGRAKLPEASLKLIVKQYNNGSHIKEIAQDFGISKSTVYSVLRKHTWKNSPRPTAHIRKQIGVLHHNAHLTEDIVLQIRTLYFQGLNKQEVADKLQISKATVNYVVARKTWRHIDIKPSQPKHWVFTPAQAKIVRELYANGVSIREISARYNAKYGTVWAIIRNLNHKP